MVNSPDCSPPRPREVGETAFGKARLPLAGALPLIPTKLRPPRLPGGLVTRARLLEQLAALPRHRLALVQGAAGFGKTTLLLQWLARQADGVAWLTLNDDDNFLPGFLRYLQAALFPEQDASLEPDMLLADTVRALQAEGTPHYLVLDDYHCITAPDIHHFVQRLLRHAPDNLHLLIASRTEPPLALSQWRAHGELLEISASALRFDLDEAQRYFTNSRALPLEGADIRRLLTLTEGWITGMQLAAMSPGMDSRPGDAIEQLSHGTRLVSRYFNDIVFRTLPPDVHDFLLRTAVLERLHARLCNAVTGGDNGDAMLAWLQRHNLFLHAQDEQGEWCRYHPLFAEVLRARLARRRELSPAALHERASHWFAGEGLWAEAVRHALAAGKPEQTLAHAESGARSLAGEGDLDTLLSWLQQLPLSVQTHPTSLLLTLAWTLAHRFRFAECDALLSQIHQRLRDGQLTLDRDTLTELRAVGAINAALADAPHRARALSEPLLQTLPQNRPWVAGLVCNVLSHCYLAEGRYADALAVQHHVPPTLLPEDNLLVAVYRASIMGQVFIRQADFNTGAAYYRDALAQAERLTGEASSGALAILAQLAEVLYERGQWQEIDQRLAHRLAALEKVATLDGLLRVYRALIRRAQAAGDHARIETLLERGLAIATQRQWTRLHCGLLAERLWVRLRENDLVGARQVLDQLKQAAPPETDDNPATRTITDLVTLCDSRLRLRAGDYAGALPALEQLGERLATRGRTLAMLHVDTLRACCLWHLGQPRAAQRLITPVLQRGRQQQLLHTLLDAGDALRPLLQACQPHCDSPEARGYIRQLLQQGQPPEDGGLVEPLSPREHETLRLVANGQTNKEIARSLAISTETVKWHLKNLYAKLGVSSRTQALHRANEANLL